MDVRARQHTQYRGARRRYDELRESGVIPSTDHRGLPRAVAIQWNGPFGLRTPPERERIRVLTRRDVTRPSPSGMRDLPATRPRHFCPIAGLLGISSDAEA